MSSFPYPRALRDFCNMSQSPFVSYSQNGEDVLLWRVLKEVQRGCYIDVGAQDPVVDSVTKAFYERGWRGINIEPVKQWHDRLVRDRPHDINLRVAVSNRSGSIKLFEVEGSGLSTSDPEFARRHEAEGHALHEQIVQCATLDQICADNDVRAVHFLKIDCEGAEKPALEGISLSEVRPWIILLEATEPNSTKPTWSGWEHLLTERGYRFVFFDGLNRFYLANEHLDLAAAFDAPVNVFDNARRFSEINAQTQVDRLHIEIEGLKGAATVSRLQAELAAANSQGEVLTIERDSIAAERDRIAAERDNLAAGLSRLVIERDQAMADRDGAMAECNALAAEHDALAAERNAIKTERDDLRARHAAAQYEAAVRQAEVSRLEASQAELLSSHSWRITAPLRSCSRVARGGYRHLRKVIYLVLRPFAHGARPMLNRLAARPAARRVVVRVFGRHSRLVNMARLFLFGPPAADPVVEVAAPPETRSEEEAALSARGRDMLSTLSEMGVGVKGESQRASRT
jgi:FkbM family methyltransferase